MTKRKPHAAGAQALDELREIEDDDFFDVADDDEPRGDQRPRIKLVPFDEIKIGTDPPSLVQGLVPRVGLTVVWGPPKSGKSFWTFDLCMHVALGWPYRGRRVQRGPVIYCAFEGHDQPPPFANAFSQSRPESPVLFAAMPARARTRSCRADRGDRGHALGATAPVAVVLDTLNRSLGGSESRDEDMGAYIRAADAVREAFSCAVIVVHHCGVDDRRPRGHTSLAGATDAQIAIKRDGAAISSPRSKP